MTELIQDELREARFNDLLNGHVSTRIAYLRAEPCPNWNWERGAPASPCPLCGGLGYLYTNPVTPALREVELTRAPDPSMPERERLPSMGEVLGIVDEDGRAYPPEGVTVLPDGTVRWDASDRPADYALYTVTLRTQLELRAGVQNVMARKEYQARGEVDVLDLSMTIPRHLPDGVTLNPAWDVWEQDRFILLDQWRRYGQTLRRGFADALTYRHVRDVQVKAYENGAAVPYQEGDAFTVEDGKIVWAPGGGPPRGTSYAVTAQMNPEYYAFLALPQTRQQDGKPLPRRVLLRGMEKHPNLKPTLPVPTR